jgi:hypothetical protein
MVRSRDCDARLAERAMRDAWPVLEAERPKLAAQRIEVVPWPRALDPAGLAG